MTVGQAVRREVAAMGEGIERTLARAVELETLVHTEVNELERAYSQNEMRIRGLVDGLGSERDALISHAERVRSSISGAHETLRDELGSASDMIRDFDPVGLDQAVDDHHQFRRHADRPHQRERHVDLRFDRPAAGHHLRAHHHLRRGVCQPARHANRHADHQRRRRDPFAVPDARRACPRHGLAARRRRRDAQRRAGPAPDQHRADPCPSAASR